MSKKERTKIVSYTHTTFGKVEALSIHGFKPKECRVHFIEREDVWRWSRRRRRDIRGLGETADGSLSQMSPALYIMLDSKLWHEIDSRFRRDPEE